MRQRTDDLTTSQRRKSSDHQRGEPRKWGWWSIASASLEIALRQARRLAVLVIGTTILLLGIVMLVTPGPAVVVIPIGLAILAIEFVWARRLLHSVRGRIKNALPRARQDRREDLPGDHG